jgi:c-di-GMP-binding flagellar brake protein YcgR
MSDASQGMVFLYWGMLVAGAGLSSFGLVRGLARYRDSRLANVDDEGEIVIGDGRLDVGQSLVVAPRARGRPMDPLGAVSGRIESIGRKYYVLALDTEVPAQVARMATAVVLGDQNDPLIDRAIWPCAGAMVTVSVTAAAEIYRFSGKIYDVQTTARGIRLFVSRPAVLARIQRRNHARVNLTVPATFERVSMPQSRSGASGVRIDAPVHGTVRNISGGGLHAQIGGVLRIHELDTMLRLFQPETTVRIGLPIPTLPRNALFARVRSAGRAVVAGGLTLQVACEFLPMPAWEQEIVIQHVFQFQREQLRNIRMRRHGSQPGFYQ